MGNNPFGLDKFIAEIGQGGVAKPSHFFVIIDSPVTAATDSQTLALRIDSVNMPGRSLSTFTRQTIGRPRQIPYSFVTLPVQITVILSETMWERQFFMNWQDSMIGDIRSSANHGESPITSDVGYYDDSVGTMEIMQFAESPAGQGREQSGSASAVLGRTLTDAAQAFGFNTSTVTKPFGFNPFGIGNENVTVKHSTKITLHELFPITVNEIPMSWDAEGLAKLTVEFQYAYFTEEHSALDSSRGDSKSAFRQAIEGFGRFIPAASLIRQVGIKKAAKITGRAAVSQFEGLNGVFKSINPL